MKFVIKGENPARYHSQRSYAKDCLPDVQRIEGLKEQLRYKHHYLNALDLGWRVMQRLGNIGRRWFPGFDPKWSGRRWL